MNKRQRKKLYKKAFDQEIDEMTEKLRLEIFDTLQRTEPMNLENVKEALIESLNKIFPDPNPSFKVWAEERGDGDKRIAPTIHFSIPAEILR